MASNRYREAHPEWFDEKGRVQPWVLRALIDYDPETGSMTWKERGPEWFLGYQGNICFQTPDMAARKFNNKEAGRPAISSVYTTKGGTYCQGAVFGIKVQRHIIAFAMHHNRYASLITSSDGDMTNTSANNLKETDRSSVRRESEFFNQTGLSIYLGVHLNKRGTGWTAKISINRKQIYLGDFKTQHEAADAYDRAALKYLGPTAYLNMAVHPEPEPAPKPAPITRAEAKISAGDDF